MECITIAIMLGVCFGVIWNMVRALTYMYAVPVALEMLAINIEGRR